jgi:hypothetical protein
VSYKVECNTAGSTTWASNALRFATSAEGEAYGHDLFMRWTALNEYRVIECEDPVNYKWDNQLGAVSLEGAST